MTRQRLEVHRLGQRIELAVVEREHGDAAFVHGLEVEVLSRDRLRGRQRIGTDRDIALFGQCGR
jgi:hypothetical protein